MGLPAARVGDMHVCPMVTPGVPPVPHVGGPILPPGGITVLIGGVPAARMGDMCTCVGPPDVIAKGSTGVFIMGMPAARMGDITAHGGSIVVGLPTVLIGEVMPSPPPVVMPPMVIVNVMLSESEVNSEQNLQNALQKAPDAAKAPIAQAVTLVQAAASGNPFCEVCNQSMYDSKTKSSNDTPKIQEPVDVEKYKSELKDNEYKGKIDELSKEKLEKYIPWEKVSGISVGAIAQIKALCVKENVNISVRPGNLDCIPLIKKIPEEYLPKPEKVKQKTINELDELIGAKKEDRGKVGLFKPKDITDPEIKKLQKTDPAKYEKVKKRIEERKKEWDSVDKYVDEKGNINVYNLPEGISQKDGILVDTKSGRPFTGDFDIFEITDKNGKSLNTSTNEFGYPNNISDYNKMYKIVAQLKKSPFYAQHPPHADYNIKFTDSSLIKKSDRHKRLSIIEFKNNITKSHKEFNEDGTKNENAKPLTNFRADCKIEEKFTDLELEKILKTPD